MLRRFPFGTPDATGEDRQKRESDLWMAFEDAAKMPALETEAGRRLGRADARGSGELVKQRHLADDLTRAEGRQNVLGAGPQLHDLDLAGADDEHPDAHIALTEDLLTGGIRLLDGGLRDRVERPVVEVGEPGNFAQELDTGCHGRIIHR